MKYLARFTAAPNFSDDPYSEPENVLRLQFSVLFLLQFPEFLKSSDNPQFED
jgi:hypothetical protein